MMEGNIFGHHAEQPDSLFTMHGLPIERGEQDQSKTLARLNYIY